MHGTRRSDRKRVSRPAGADPARRRLLFLIAGLPLAVRGALAGCSGREEERPAEPGASPAPPQPSPKPPPGPGAGGPAAAPAPAQPPAPGAGAGAAAGDQLVTEVEAMKPTVQALQYVHQSPHADQHCANCQFFTPKSGERGNCQLFAQGLVEAKGWCTSWTKKAGA
jgi:hypothetical protein